MSNLPVEGYRLSPQQSRLWSLGRAAANDPYRAFGSVRIVGHLDLVIFKTAVRNVANGYEIFRSTFHEISEQESALQVINNTVDLEIALQDLSKTDASEQEQIIAEMTSKLKNMPLDYETGPLVAMFLVKLGEEEHQWVISASALVADQSTIQHYVQEVNQYYQAQLRGEPKESDVFQYADIAEWQNELIEGEDGMDARAFWQEFKITEPSKRSLPLEKNPSDTKFFVPKTHSFELSLDETAELKEFARRHECSLNAVLLSTWNVLLHRLTGESDILVGFGIEERQYDELKGAMGPLSRYLPYKSHLSNDARAHNYFRETQNRVSEMVENQAFFSWEDIWPSKLKEDNLDYFPFGFDFKEIPDDFSGGDTTFIIRSLDATVDRFKLRLTATMTQVGLQISLAYDQAFYKEEDVERIAGQFSSLLANVIIEPEALINKLDILSKDERKKLFVEFNKTAADYPKDVCIHQLIEAQSASTPDAVAVEFEGTTLTYAELNARANQVAHYLQSLEVGPDDLVGICMQRSPEMIVGILGILKAGGAYVPLDPVYPQERLEFMIEDTNAPVILTTKTLLKILPKSNSKYVLMDEEWDKISRESQQNPTSHVGSDNLVYVIYTSGSTGKPKGVMVKHRSLVCTNNARIEYFNQEVGKFLLLSSFAFDSSVVGIFWTLTQGGTLLLIPEEKQKNLKELSEIIADQEVSHTLTLPSFYQLILEYAKPGELDTLKTVIVAGEACPKIIIDRHFNTIPNTDIYSEYGATETSVWSSVYDCSLQQTRFASLGNPIQNAQMYILNTYLQPVPTGVTGEVYFGGDGVAKGYLNRPVLTAMQFIPDPFSPQEGARLYKSGDLARFLPNGEIEFLGRIDNQVKIRGFRVELEEIEVVLLQHPLILEVAVTAHEFIEGGKRLVAYVVGRDKSRIPTSELRKYLKQKLPDFMIPAAFVFLDSLPRTPNGKVDRAALPKPGTERPDLDQGFISPHSKVEQALARIWEETLNLDKVGLNDNFFELGGDSILSLRIIAKANQEGIVLSPMQLFQHQTIAELSPLAGENRQTHAEQGTIAGKIRLTPIQHWFFDLQPTAPNHANISLLLEVKERLDLSILQEALEFLISHHDALRIRYIQQSAVWQQSLNESEKSPLITYVDLSGVSKAQKRSAISEKTTDAQSSLDIEHGPTLGVIYFDLGEGTSDQLFVVIHHLVADVISLQIFMEDWMQAYHQIQDGDDVSLPAKTTSFKYWAEKLHQHAQTELFQSEISYWTDNLSKPPTPIPVDFDGKPEDNTFESTRSVVVSLNEEQTRSLLKDVPKAYRTQINDVLLTPLVQVFSKWTGNADLLLDLEGHGREDIFEEVDLSRTMGWFTSLAPLSLKLTGIADMGEALMSIKEQLRKIPVRGIGFGLLRYLSEDEKILSAATSLPKPEINFNHLGMYELVLPDQDLFSIADEYTGGDFGGENLRGHLIEIVSLIRENQLHVEWTYSANYHKSSTIEQLANDYLQTLIQLIMHCVSNEAGGFTPSDFPEAELSQDQLDNLLLEIDDRDRE